MYDLRIPLYEKYADISIDCSGDNFERIVEKVVDLIHKKTGRS
jgi:shikimate kinase